MRGVRVTYRAALSSGVVLLFYFGFFSVSTTLCPSIDGPVPRPIEPLSTDGALPAGLMTGLLMMFLSLMITITPLSLWCYS